MTAEEGHTCDGTCAYVARKKDPSNWHGEELYDWRLDWNPPFGLNQEVWECPHAALDEREYCVFHTHPDKLPPEIEEGEELIKTINDSSTIDDSELARRKKEFVGATFGPIDIEGRTLAADDEHPIRLDHATFTAGIWAVDIFCECGIRAHGASFETGGKDVPGEIEAISFRSAEFSGDSYLSFIDAAFSGNYLLFDGAKFSGDRHLWFIDADFSGVNHFSFSGIEFSGDCELSFTNAEFNGDGHLWFRGAEFSGDGDLSFAGAEFSGNGNLSFEDATISWTTNFASTGFKQGKQVTFADAEIHEPLTFLNSGDVRNIPANFDFSNAVFYDELRFRTQNQLEVDQDDTEERPPFTLVFAKDVDFSGTQFERPPNFSSTQFRGDVDFTNATLQNATFRDADLTGPNRSSSASFDRAYLTGANFSNAILTGASFERALLTRAELLGADFTRTKLYGALLGDARINRETTFWLSLDASDLNPDESRRPVRWLRSAKRKLRQLSHKDSVDPYCVYDPRYRAPNREPNIEKAAEVYGTLETLARQNSQPRLASEAFLGRKDVKFREYWNNRNWIMTTRSIVPSAVARYGESPLRVLGTGAMTILVCGLIYYLFDLVENSDGEFATLFESIYFSALTFTTLGYGDFNPVNRPGQVLAVAETSMGVILLAILVFVFGRRATR